mgnify:CR=1 FL=1
MSRYILAFDQGTTSSRSIVFDENGHIISVAQKEFTQHYPHPGWVEHDPDEIWQSQMETAKDAIRKAGISPSEILAIGITNQLMEGQMFPLTLAGLEDAMGALVK